MSIAVAESNRVRSSMLNKRIGDLVIVFAQVFTFCCITNMISSGLTCKRIYN